MVRNICRGLIATTFLMSFLFFLFPPPPPTYHVDYNAMFKEHPLEGTQPSSKCTMIDTSGNHVAATKPCGGADIQYNDITEILQHGGTVVVNAYVCGRLVIPDDSKAIVYNNFFDDKAKCGER